MNVTSIQSKAAAPVAGAASVPPQQAAERRQLIKATNVINASQTFGANNELVFSIDRDTHLPVLRVVDSTTKDVLLQLPPQYVLNLAADAQGEERRKQDEAPEG
jgi:uncharacterized FlaG/YvyC family protein